MKVIIFFVLLLISICGFAGEEVPCPETPKETPSAPSEPSDSHVSTPPSETGGNVKDQLGGTLNPDQGGGGKDGVGTLNIGGGGDGKKSPDQLTSNFLKDFKVDPWMWRGYLKYISEMSALLKSREEAKMNEYVRKAAWENQSGLTHARERYDQARQKHSEVYNKYWDAERKASEAISASSDLERRMHNTKLYLEHAPTEERRDNLRQEIKELEKEEKILDSARHETWEQRNEAMDKHREVWKEMGDRGKDVEQAFSRYQQMEVNYESNKNASIPKPKN